MDKTLPAEPDRSSQAKHEDQCYNFDLQTLNFCLYNSCAVQIVDVTSENVNDKGKQQRRLTRKQLLLAFLSLWCYVNQTLNHSVRQVSLPLSFSV